MIDRETLPRTFEAEVTPEDIALGKPCEPCHCPLALAVGRALGIDPEGQVFVTRRSVEVISDALSLARYGNPPEAKEFVRVFDRELSPPKPGKFVFHAGVIFGVAPPATACYDTNMPSNKANPGFGSFPSFDGTGPSFSELGPSLEVVSSKLLDGPGQVIEDHGHVFVPTRRSANVSEGIEAFVKNVQAFLDAHYSAKYPSGFPSSPLIETMRGPRYVRLVAVDRDRLGGRIGRSAWGFIDLASGDVLKAAGWKTPAKGPRGSVFASTFDGYGVTEYGPRYR